MLTWPKSTGRTLIAWTGAIVLIVLSTWLFLWNIGQSSISGASDEVIYVRIIQGILHGEHIFPLYHGSVPSFEKPPLKLWLNALFPLLLGESNFSYRLFDGLLGLTSVSLTVLLAYRVLGSSIAALCCGFIVVSVPEWILFQHSFRSVVLDGLLTALTLGMGLATWSFIRCASPGIGSVWTVAILGSLAVLTKSIGGMVPVMCAASAIIASEPSFRRLRQLWPLMLPALVLGMYIAAVALVGGRPALKTFIGTEIFERAFSGFEGHNAGDRWFYVRYVLHRGGLVPVPLMVLGLATSVLRIHQDVRFRFLLPWVVLPLLLYSLSSSRVPWYISPFAPYAALLAVCGIICWGKRCHSIGLRLALIAILLFLVLPPYARSLNRVMTHVADVDQRIELDILVEGLKDRYDRFIIVGNALSGRSRPVRGRFNVEGIYREMLKPRLAVVATIKEVEPVRGTVLFVRESEVLEMPEGSTLLAKLAPFSLRSYPVLVIALNPHIT